MSHGGFTGFCHFSNVHVEMMKPWSNAILLKRLGEKRTDLNMKGLFLPNVPKSLSLQEARLVISPSWLQKWCKMFYFKGERKTRRGPCLCSGNSGIRANKTFQWTCQFTWGRYTVLSRTVLPYFAFYNRGIEHEPLLLHSIRFVNDLTMI